MMPAIFCELKHAKFVCLWSSCLCIYICPVFTNWL